MSYLQKFMYSWGALGRVGTFIWQHKVVLLYVLPWIVGLSDLDFGFTSILGRYVRSLFYLFPFFLSFIHHLLMTWIVVWVTQYVLKALHGERPSFWRSLLLSRSLLVNFLLWVLLITIVANLYNLSFITARLFYSCQWSKFFHSANALLLYILYVCTPYAIIFMIDQHMSVFKAFSTGVKFFFHHFLESSSFIVLTVLQGFLREFLFGPSWSFVVQTIVNWCLLSCLLAIIIILPVIIYNDNKATIS